MQKSVTSFMLILLFSSTQVFAQARVNRKKITFQKQTETITKASGWSYNKTLGEWVDYPNVISSSKQFKEKYKKLQGKYMMSRTNQNFLSMQFKTVNLNNQEHYVLVVEKWDGSYKYPSIKKDWQTYKVREGYIFSADEYKKLNSADSLVELKTKYRTFTLSKPDDTRFLAKIQTELGREKSKYSTEYTFPVRKTKVDGKDLVRFYAPSMFSKYSKYNFEKKYFEVPQEEFKKLLTW